MSYMEEYLEDNDPEVAQFDAELDEVCRYCFVDEYGHDEDCPLSGESMVDEEYDYALDCE